VALRPYSKCSECGKRNVRTTKPEFGRVCWRCVRRLKVAATAQRRKVRHGATFDVEPPG
jgi:hypothetical protein